MGIQKLFKKWIVKRDHGQCQILIPLIELDAFCEQIEAEVENGITDDKGQLKQACKFLLSFVPEWAKAVPLNLDPTMYGTLSAEGDRKVQKRVSEIVNLVYRD